MTIFSIGTPFWTRQMLLRPALRHYLDWSLGSRRWNRYVPRAGDIIITMAPKCGTTWVQRILGLLMFNDPAPRSVDDDFPWIDFRQMPVEETHAFNAGTTGRRRGIFSDRDLALYDAKVRAKFTPAQAAWIEKRRRRAGCLQVTVD